MLSCHFMYKRIQEQRAYANLRGDAALRPTSVRSVYRIGTMEQGSTARRRYAVTDYRPSPDSADLCTLEYG